jgi:hypothetical protein
VHGADNTQAVTSPEPEPPPSLDTVQRMLSRTLSRLESDIESALRADPGEEDALRRLDEDRAELEDRVDGLRRTLTRLADVAPIDVNRITTEVLDEILLELEKPLELSVAWAQTLPAPSVSESSLRSVLFRSIDLIVRHARPGDRVSLSTARVDDEVTLSMAIEPYAGDEELEPFDVLMMRCRSLGEFVRELGGRFLLADHDGVHLEIRLWCGARTPGPQRDPRA